MMLAADVDELNFLAARLGQLDASEIAELNAALQNPKGGFENIGQIIDFTENTDYYVHLPDVHTAAALGDYYLNRSGMVDMPQEWKSGIDTTQFGRYIAQQEQGAFTEYGYIVKSGDKWQRVHEGQSVPEEYRVMAFPQPEVIHGTENQVIVDVALVNVGCQHIGVFALQHFVGKLIADLMGLFRRGLTGSKGLYQVVGQIVALLVRLRQQHFKFNVCCFIGAGKGGHQQLIVGLVRVLDVVQGFF